MSDDSMYREHRDSYRGFIRLVTYSTAAVVIALALMALFIL